MVTTSPEPAPPQQPNPAGDGDAGPAAARSGERTSMPLGAPFWRLFASSGTSNLSDGVLQAALPLLAASLTRDPLLVASMGTFAFLPWLLLAIPGGALVDRVNRRTAMAVANTARAVLLAGLAAMITAGLATMPLLYGAAFALGCAEVIYDSAARAMLPAVVGKGGLERGNSLLATVESVGNIFAGAPIGAWLFVVAASLPFWGNAGGYLLAAGMVLTVSGRFRVQPKGAEHASMAAEIGEGLRWLLRHRLLRALMITTGLSGLLASMCSGILVLFALEVLRLTERGYGIALAVAGVGAIIGSVASPRLTALLGRPVAMGACEILSALLSIAIAVFPHPIGGVVIFSLVTALTAAFNVQVLSLRQALIPEELFGRVQGAYRTVIWGGIPLGTLAGGALGSALGLPAVFILSGIAGTGVGALTLGVLYRHRAEIDAAFR